MRTRTMKRFGLLLCSCVMATTAALGAISLTANEVNANAETVTPKGTAVGTLGADGLYQTTMTQIAPVGGVASGVDNVYFEGYGESTFFLTEFTGKNAPNFAIQATQAYSDWNAETNATAGLLITQSSEFTAGEYESDAIVVSPGLNTTSRNSGYWETRIKASDYKGKGPGLNNLSDNENYVMILGAYGTGNFVRGFEYYLFTLSEEGVLTQVNHLSAPLNVTAGSVGSLAVIYPTISDAQEEFSFKYSLPGDSVVSVVENLNESVAYKKQLQAYINEGLTAETLARTEATLSATSLTASSVDYIEMDMAEGNTTYIMVDFVAGNAPNIAFNATKGYSTWNGENADQAGVLFAPSSNGNISINQGAVLKGFTTTKTQVKQPLTTSPQKNWRPYLGHLQSQSAWGSGGVKERYIMLAGFTLNTAGNETLDLKIYYLENGQLKPYIDITSSFDYASVKNSKLVLYGNMSVQNAAVYDPSGVCFKYSKPAASIDALIKGLGNEYAYKAKLAETLGVDMASVTIKNEAGETVKTESVYGEYALPASNAKGFIGYEYQGALYGAGSVLTVTSDITVNEVTIDLAMTAGARVRAKEADGHYGGLRFEATATAEKLTAWANNIALYGVVIPTDLIEGEFDYNEEGAKSVALTNFLENEGTNTYYITLTDVYYYNYNRAFSARAYAEVTYADETKAVVALTDYSEKDNSRSVYEVAKAALADTQYGYSAEQIAFIKGYIEYTVDLKVNANGDLELLNANESNYEVTKGGDGKYTVTVKNAPARIANAGAIPVTVWQEVEGSLVAVRTVAVAATLENGNLISVSF